MQKLEKYKHIYAVILVFFFFIGIEKEAIAQLKASSKGKNVHSDSKFSAFLKLGFNHVYAGNIGVLGEIMEPNQKVSVFGSYGLSMFSLSSAKLSYNYAIGGRLHFLKLNNASRLNLFTHYGWIDHYYDYRFKDIDYKTVYGTSFGLGWEYRTKSVFLNFDLMYVNANLISNKQNNILFKENFETPFRFSGGGGIELNFLLNKFKKNRGSRNKRDNNIKENISNLLTVPTMPLEDTVINTEQLISIYVNHQTCLEGKEKSIDNNLIKGSCGDIAVYQQTNVNQFVFLSFLGDTLDKFTGCNEFLLSESKDFMKIFLFNTRDIPEDFCCQHSFKRNSSDSTINTQEFVAEDGVVQIAFSIETNDNTGILEKKYSIRLKDIKFYNKSIEDKTEIYFDEILIWNIKNNVNCN